MNSLHEVIPLHYNDAAGTRLEEVVCIQKWTEINFYDSPLTKQ